MISWMQNNNKYLVITIWVATIAFIGAGFVGWGSVNFGSSANSIAKVGDISLDRTKFGFSYNNAYANYAQKFGNKFDKEKAKELGLDKLVLRNLINQALLLNFAKENGIVVSDKEVGLEVASFQSFKDKNGNFNKDFYDNFLKSRGLKAKDFESILRDELTVKKLMDLIDVKPLKLEKEAMSATFKIGDKIKYKIIKNSDINITVTDNDLKSFWSSKKDRYLTKTSYKLELLWTQAKDLNISDAEIERFYKENSFNYVDKSGKVKDLKDVKELVKNDLTLEKIKKQAAIDRSRFKKSKIKPSEVVTLEEGDNRLSANIWDTISKSKNGEFLKPKAIKDRYVSIHIVSKKRPEVMSFEAAKELVKKDYIALKKKEELNKLVQEALKNSSKFTLETKDYITLSKFSTILGLSQQDSLLVTRGIFASSKKVNSIKLTNGAFVYEVVKQKILDNNSSNNLDSEIASIKSNELSINLLKSLSNKYSTEVYIKDFK